MKLSKDEKSTRKYLKKMVQERDGFITNQDQYCTVVVVPKHSGSQFCEVAAAYCGNGDTWNRKRGEYEALQKWDMGCSINVLVNGRTAEQVANDFMEILY